MLTARDALLREDPDRAERERLAVALVREYARHATPSGGSVTVTAEHLDGRATLTVCDTGPGVPPGERVLIFERFGRGDSSRSRDTGGAGLGLGPPIARGLARAHGGDLTYVNRPAGSCFLLELPVEQIDIAATTARRPPRTGR